MNEECLENLVEEYLDEDYCCDERAWEKFILSQSTLREAVTIAVLGRDEKKILHSHLWRPVNTYPGCLENAKEYFMEKLAELERCENFDEILEITEGAVGNVYGFGELCAYDTAQRIGYYHGFKPDKIYLHAGTLEGARNLGLDVKGKKYLEISELPAPLRKLSASDLENFFCIMKKELAKCR